MRKIFSVAVDDDDATGVAWAIVSWPWLEMVLSDATEGEVQTIHNVPIGYGIDYGYYDPLHAKWEYGE